MNLFFKIFTVMTYIYFLFFLQAWLSGSHNRTTKSGILVENPITRVQDEASSNDTDSESTKGNLNLEDTLKKD